MRTFHKTLTSLGILTTAILMQLTACSAPASDCTQNLEPCEPPVVGPPPGCEASPKDDLSVINKECGYFVSTNGDDMNAGTAEKPFKTLGKAVEAAKAAKARVYVCADGTYAERVELPGGVSLFGGFSCMNGAWNYDAATGATIQPGAPGPDDVQASLRVTGMGTSHIEDLIVRASDAKFPGGSSIAVVVEKATVNFVRTEIIAGAGAEGAPGETPMDSVGPMQANDPLIIGNPGQEACKGGDDGNPGGEPKANPICGASIGGKGGNGRTTLGDDGGDGVPAPNPNPSNKGIGGTGDGGQGCEPGQPGANGATGEQGVGATAMENGALDASKGYVGASGKPGGKGTIGQGGGGGGGSRGKMNCFGASGGSGGAGGCGGNGGLGGMAGGSSIGIVSIEATLSFRMVDITTGVGGRGGDGGFGQAGGVGGLGGLGGNGATMGGATPAGCDGGKGGNGGIGGNGGGGRGGHSIGIAHKGGGVSDMGVTVVTGTPGGGGNGNAAGGIDAITHAFP